AQMIWRDLKFGDRPFSFSMARAEKVGVYGPYALGWFGTLVGYFVLMATMVGVMFAIGPERLYAQEAGAYPDLLVVVAIYGFMALVCASFALVWAPYHTAMLRSIAAGVGIDEARFILKVRTLPIWWLTVSIIFLLLVSLGFLMPFVQALSAWFRIH